MTNETPSDASQPPSVRLHTPAEAAELLTVHLAALVLKLAIIALGLTFHGRAPVLLQTIQRETRETPCVTAHPGLDLHGTQDVSVYDGFINHPDKISGAARGCRAMDEQLRDASWAWRM